MTKKTLREILKDKEYPYIEERILIKDKEDEEYDIFSGVFAYKNNELISLDGDTYSLDNIYVKWEEWTLNEKIETERLSIDAGTVCLTVYKKSGTT